MTLKPIAAAISVTIFSALAAQTQAADLDFSKQTHTAQSAEINGQTIAYRAFENISYVKNPVEADY